MGDAHQAILWIVIVLPGHRSWETEDTTVHFPFTIPH